MENNTQYEQSIPPSNANGYTRPTNPNPHVMKPEKLYDCHWKRFVSSILSTIIKKRLVLSK